jgi:nicotinamidase-related amidase
MSAMLLRRALLPLSLAERGQGVRGVKLPRTLQARAPRSFSKQRTCVVAPHPLAPSRKGEGEWCPATKGSAMSEKQDRSALLLIDVQQGFDEPYWGARNNPQAEDNIAQLLAAWRADGKPVVHVKHNSRLPRSPLHPSNAGNAFKDFAAPREGEAAFGKDVNSAFIGTDLEAHLRQNGIGDLVIVGLTTPHCISTTARMAANLDFKTIVVSDATAAHAGRGPDGKDIDAETMHYHALAALNGEFAEIVSTADLIGQLRA